LIHSEHCFEAIGAEPGVGTDATVIVNRNALANVTDTPILAVVSDPLIGEAVGAMRSVAERLVLGTATAAKGYPSNSGARLTIGAAQVRHCGWRHVVEEVVRTVW
jgi:hypothetical protein